MLAVEMLDPIEDLRNAGQSVASGEGEGEVAENEKVQAMV